MNFLLNLLRLLFASISLCLAAITFERLLRKSSKDDSVKLSDAPHCSASQELNQKSIFQDIAKPLSQLIAMENSSRTGSFPISVNDVLDVGQDLVKVAKEHGIEQIGAPGEITTYQPLRHECLSLTSNVHVGDRVIVRLPGFVFQDSIILAAGVEPYDEGTASNV